MYTHSTFNNKNNNETYPSQYIQFIESAPVQLELFIQRFKQIYRSQYFPDFNSATFNAKMIVIERLGFQKVINFTEIEELLLSLESMDAKLKNIASPLSSLKDDLREYILNQKTQIIPEILEKINSSNLAAELKSACKTKLFDINEMFRSRQASLNQFMVEVNDQYKYIKEMHDLLLIEETIQPEKTIVKELLCSIHGGFIEDFTPYEDAINETVEILLKDENSENEYDQHKRIKAILQKAYDDYHPNDTHNDQYNYTF